MSDVLATLRELGIRATPQRIAVAEYVLHTDTHPSADQVLNNVQCNCPTISRATVYNSLNLLVEKGLLRSQILKEGTIVFDPMVHAHHHFIDEDTGEIYDIPWDAVKVTGGDSFDDLEIREYQVVMKGHRRKT